MSFETSEALAHEPSPVTLGDVLTGVPEPSLEPLLDAPVPTALKDPADGADLAHRRFDGSEFWRAIPAFRRIGRDEFLDHRFQLRHSVKTVEQLAETVGELVGPEFLDDVRAGIDRAPMSLRISPYVLSLIDWSAPYEDALRIQFLPVGSTQLPDHPRLRFDSLHEQADSPTPGLVHRYPDKALFLPLDVCPVYCRFCTRSYAIGGDTDAVDKVDFKPKMENWEKAFAYLASRPEIEDVVVSGGDAFMLPAKHLRTIGEVLLAIPHIRRIRYASKGPAVMPMKILSDAPWTTALADLCEEGRQRGKEVCLHTHFNGTHEITEVTRQAMQELFSRGVTVRNQSVLIRGVNDDAEEMTRLVKQLSYMNVQPYYVYQHDMVRHVEELRTRVGAAIELERQVRGATAGFNTPLFIVDLPGGGGKRDIHSFEHYDETTGISVYRSPAVDDERFYCYLDPLHLLPAAGRRRWEDPAQHGRMLREAVEAAGLGHLEPAHAMDDALRPRAIELRDARAAS